MRHVIIDSIIICVDSFDMGINLFKKYGIHPVYSDETSILVYYQFESANGYGYEHLNCYIQGKFFKKYIGCASIDSATKSIILNEPKHILELVNKVGLKYLKKHQKANKIDDIYNSYCNQDSIITEYIKTNWLKIGVVGSLLIWYLLDKGWF